MLKSLEILKKSRFKNLSSYTRMTIMPRYDILLPKEDDIPRYRGRIPDEGRLHLGLETRNRNVALRNVLDDYGCSELFSEVNQAIKDRKGQLEKREKGWYIVLERQGDQVIGIRYETTDGTPVITRQQRKRASINKYKNKYEIGVRLANSALRREEPYPSFGFSPEQAIASLAHIHIHDEREAGIETNSLIALYRAGSNAIGVRLIRHGKKRPEKLNKSEPHQLAFSI